MMYLVDANVLIEAKNRYYAFDIAPGFWAWLDRAHRQGAACSIDSVREELLRGDDELAEWARAHREFFRAIDQRAAARFGALTEWVTTQGYRPSAINAFTGKDADFQLIAYGMAHSCARRVRRSTSERTRRTPGPTSLRPSRGWPDRHRSAPSMPSIERLGPQRRRGSSVAPSSSDEFHWSRASSTTLTTSSVESVSWSTGPARPGTPTIQLSIWSFRSQ